MREPLPDKIMPAEHETATEGRISVPRPPVEREVQLSGPQSPAEVIRERVDGGFYHTPAVVEVVARRIVERGDLQASAG